MYSINKFTQIGGEIIAACTASDLPSGAVVGQQGTQALLVQTPDGVAVVSRPAIEGPVAGAWEYPAVDLSWAF